MNSFPERMLGLAAAATLAWLSFAPASVRAAELLMVERDGCPYCAKWQHDVGQIYPKSSEAKTAPLRLHRLDEGQPDVQLAKPVRFTPTFLVVEDGREIGRITGYMNDAMFWGLLDSILERLREAQTNAGQ